MHVCCHLAVQLKGNAQARKKLILEHVPVVFVAFNDQENKINRKIIRKRL